MRFEFSVNKYYKCHYKWCYKRRIIIKFDFVFFSTASSLRTAIPTISPQSQARMGSILLPGGMQVPPHFEASMVSFQNYKTKFLLRNQKSIIIKNTICGRSMILLLMVVL